MAHKVKKLIECTLQLLVLLNALLDALGAHRVNISLNATIDGLLARVEGKTQVVESLLSEALICGQCSQHLSWHVVQDRLQEVEESNVIIFVSIK